MFSDVKNCAFIAEHCILAKAPADLYYVYMLVWKINIIKFEIVSYRSIYLMYKAMGTKLDSSDKLFFVYRKMRHKVCLPDDVIM